MDLFQEIIRSGKQDEIAEGLRTLMGLEREEPLRILAVIKFLKEQGVDSDDIWALWLYLVWYDLLN